MKQTPTSSNVVSGKKGEQTADGSCDKCCYVFTQLFIWCLIAGLVCSILFIRDSRQKTKAITLVITFLVFSHLFSIFYNLSSEEWKFLSNVKSPSQTIEMLQKSFCNPLKINLTAECWHYETYIYKGNTRRRRITTHTEEEEFRYYSGRDISGTFSIEVDKVKSSCIKSMVKLHLGIDYEFADEVSEVDYNLQKDHFIARNRPRDHYMDFVEEKLIDGFDDYVLINLTDGMPLTVNRFLFIIFLVFIPIIEVYKIYLNMVWDEQNFKIKKVISTRFDLNHNQFVTKYSGNIPKLSFGGNEQTFENVHHTKEKLFDLPTEDEINRAPAMNQMLLKRLSSYNINLGNDANHDQMPAPQNNLNSDFPQGPMKMQGYPHFNNAVPSQSVFGQQQQFTNNANTNNTATIDTELSVTNLNSNSREELGKKLI